MSELNAPLGPLMIDIAGCALQPDERARLLHPLVGGVILFSRNYRDRQQLAALCAALRALPRSRLLLAVDHEGGRVQRFREGFTAVPPMRGLGERYVDDPQAACAQARHWGRTIADELSAFDIDLCFAPVIDRDTGVSGVIGDRAFAAEPAAIVALAQAFADGLRAQGMAPTFKHFPGHGAVAADSHLELPEDGRSAEAIFSSELRPFAEVVAAGAESLMMAHVRYPAVDAWPASLSARWIGDILRRQLGFDGAVFCDDLSMHGAAVAGGLAARARMALAAGCDMLPVCNDPAGVAQLLAELSDVEPDPVASARLTRLYVKAPRAAV